MCPPRKSLQKDFLSRFGLHITPFTREISVKDRFVHALFEQPLAHLQRAVERRLSAALIAPAGTGKTALLRALVARLPEAQLFTWLCAIARREIAAALNSETAGTFPALLRRVQERLAAGLDIDGLRPVLVLDESHEIRPEVLGLLRIVTNFDMDSRLVVSLILAGQGPLARLLRQDRLADVAQRLTHCATLRLLSRPETSQYVHHRCRIAGASNCPFDPEAMEALYEVGRGNLRATDHLALKTLELAHESGLTKVPEELPLQLGALLGCAVITGVAGLVLQRGAPVARGLLWP